MIHRLSPGVLLGALACTAVLTQPVLADRYHREICVDLPLDARFPPFVIGCEAIDCCPGCPRTGELEWRVQVEGSALATMSLEFKGLPNDVVQKLSFDPDDESVVEESRLKLSGGESTLKGLPAVPPSGMRPATAYPRLEFNRAAIDRLQAEGADPDRQAEMRKNLGRFVLRVEQVMKNVVVNEYELTVMFVFCRPPQPVPPPPACDQIQLTCNTGGDEAIVLIDGRRSSGCVNDEPWRIAVIECVGNLLSNASCRSEVAVFSDDNAMELVENVAVWTDNEGDLLPVDLDPRIEVPVEIWLLTPGALADAQAEIDAANLLYNFDPLSDWHNRAGIRFLPIFHDEVANQIAVDRVGTSTDDMCEGVFDTGAWLTNLKATFFIPNRLNVYYYLGGGGVNCSGDRNVIAIGSAAYDDTLAHEFGHALSLEHIEPSDNIMYNNGTDRTRFTLGQAFRMNVNPSSIININGHRTGPTRDCPHDADTDACPPLNFEP